MLSIYEFYIWIFSFFLWEHQAISLGHQAIGVGAEEGQKDDQRVGAPPL